METGIVGQQSSEGESHSLAIGKSGSQMHEGYSSTVGYEHEFGRCLLAIRKRVIERNYY